MFFDRIKKIKIALQNEKGKFFKVTIRILGED